MLGFFDRYYSVVIYYGVVAVVWFAALFQAAHNLWAACVLFGAVTLFGLIFCAGRIRDKKPLKLPLCLSLSVFLLALRLSFWRAFDYDTAWLEFWGWTFTLILFYLFVNVAESGPDIDRFFTWAGLIILPLLLHCAWQRWGTPPRLPSGESASYVFGYGRLVIPLPGHPWEIRYGLWEIHASLINSVIMAGFTLYWVPFFWMKTTRDRRYAAVFGAGIALLLFSRSWWGFIALGLGGIFYYRRELIDRARAHRKAVALVLAGATLLLAVMLYVKTQHVIDEPSDINHYHASSRWYYWLTVLHIWKSFPWTGVGLGGFATAFPLFKISDVENTRFAHGFGPQMLCETGVIGCLALLFVAADYLRLRWKNPISRDKKPRLRPFDAALVSVLVFSVISINMDVLLNKILLFLVLGATLAPYTQSAVPLRPMGLAAAAGVLLILLSLWPSLLVASRLYAAGVYWDTQGEPLKAAALYQDAVRIEPFHAESYWRLSRLYALKYTASHAPDDLAAARGFLRQALRYKKDIRYLKELGQLK